MSDTLVDRHGVYVGRFAGPGGVPMIQVGLADPERDHLGGAFRTMPLADFHIWLGLLVGALTAAALEHGDPWPSIAPTPSALVDAVKRLVDRL